MQVERVAYFDFGDFEKVATNNIPSPWIILAKSQSIVEYGIIQDNNVARRVKVERDLSPTVQGVPLSIKESLVKQKIKHLLNAVAELRACDGVTSPDLQEFASLPSEGCCYNRCVRYTRDASGSMTPTSTVRSAQCLGTSGKGQICHNCHQAQCLLVRKCRRLNTNASIHLKAPLQKIGKARIAMELVEKRKKEKKLQEKLNAIQQKLDQESLPVDKHVHDSLLSILNGFRKSKRKRSVEKLVELGGIPC